MNSLLANEEQLICEGAQLLVCGKPFSLSAMARPESKSHPCET